MRIVCENCRAAYAIDDRLITPRGVRAMCPKCRHQQTVRNDPEATVPGAPPPARPPSRAAPATAASSVTPLDELFALPPRVAPVGRPASSEVNDEILTARAGSDALTCNRCGKVLTDTFDQALGTCDDCRQKQTGQIAAAQLDSALKRHEEKTERTSVPPPPPPETSGAVFRDLLNDAAAADQTLEMSDSAVSAAISAAAKDRIPPRAPQPFALQSAAFRYETGRTYARRRNRILIVLAIAFGVLLIACGVWFVSSRRHRVVAIDESKLARPLQDVLPRWRMTYVDLSGTALEYLEQGNARLAVDDPLAYRDAEEAFQRAVLLDPMLDDALAGYAQAVALGRGTAADDATYREALSLVQVAEQRSQDKTRAWISHAHVLLCRPDSDAIALARELANRAVNATKPGEDAHGAAMLARGRTFLSSSANLAIQDFDQALSSPKPPKRALLYRALAHEQAGDFDLAVEDLRQRMAMDPKQLEPVQELARLYVEVGQIGLARELYRKAQKADPDDLRPVIQLAEIDTQIEGKPREAIAVLEPLLKSDHPYDDDQLEQGWAQLATAHRLAGNADAAIAAAEQALKLSPSDTAAHLQLLLVDLARGKADHAATHLEALRGRELPVALFKHLEGRVRFAQGKANEALAAFQAAFAADTRRVDSLIYGAVAATKSGKPEDASQAMSEALQADPLRSGPAPAVTPIFLRPGETLDGAEGVLPKLARGDQDVMPDLYEAWLRLHQRDLAGAQKEIQRVLSIDGNNALAYAMDAIVALERGDKAKARVSGDRAAQLGRPVALAHYADGIALAAQGPMDKAARELQAAVELAPGLLAAKVALAQAQSKTDPSSARSTLLTVVSLDPSFLPAKRALYAIQHAQEASR